MVYVITGGPGFGKTTLINLLAERNFPVCQEIARALLTSTEDHKIPTNFERTVATYRANFLQQADPSVISFSDRGLPDQVGYSKYKKSETSSFLEEMVKANRYASAVFITPPWEEIYVKDQIRQENFDQAVAIHNEIVKAYLQYHYKIINLPRVNPEERVRFVLNFLGI
jgi:predicted ATPase